MWYLCHGLCSRWIAAQFNTYGASLISALNYDHQTPHEGISFGRRVFEPFCKILDLYRCSKNVLAARGVYRPPALFILYFFFHLSPVCVYINCGFKLSPPALLQLPSVLYLMTKIIAYMLTLRLSTANCLTCPIWEYKHSNARHSVCIATFSDDIKWTTDCLNTGHIINTFWFSSESKRRKRSANEFNWQSALRCYLERNKMMSTRETFALLQSLYYRVLYFVVAIILHSSMYKLAKLA